ncbi:MAG: AAA family ATPase [bacterium]
MRPDSTPAVVALAGPNGAGKSTVGPALLWDTLGISTFVNADVIARGLAAFNPESAAFEAGRVLLERLDELARRRVSFAFETTLAGRAYLRRLKTLVANGYRFHIVFLWVDSPDLCVARVQERVRSGGHAVPEDVIRRRYRSGIENFLQLYRPLSTSWRVYDNSAAPARLIAAGRESGDLDVQDEATWNRIGEGGDDGV